MKRRRDPKRAELGGVGRPSLLISRGRGGRSYLLSNGARASICRPPRVSLHQQCGGVRGPYPRTTVGGGTGSTSGMGSERFPGGDDASRERVRSSRARASRIPTGCAGVGEEVPRFHSDPHSTIGKDGDRRSSHSPRNSFASLLLKHRLGNQRGGGE